MVYDNAAAQAFNPDEFIPRLKMGGLMAQWVDPSCYVGDLKTRQKSPFPRYRTWIRKINDEPSAIDRQAYERYLGRQVLKLGEVKHGETIQLRNLFTFEEFMEKLGGAAGEDSRIRNENERIHKVAFEAKEVNL